jgi:hypothetical protein
MPPTWSVALTILIWVCLLLSLMVSARVWIRWLMHEFRHPAHALRWLFYPPVTGFVVLGFAFVVVIIMNILLLLDDLSTPSTKLPGWSWIIVIEAAACVALLGVQVRIQWLLRHQQPVHDVPESAQDVE